MTKILAIAAVSLAVLSFAGAADAGVYISLSAPAPVYYAPPVVYQQPVVYAQPQYQYVAPSYPPVVAYAAPAPAVVVAPGPVYYGYGWHYRHWR